MNTKSFLMLIVVLLGFPQLSETMITPSLLGISQSLVVSPQLVQFSMSLFFAGFAAGVSVWGLGADWWGRRRAMQCGLLFYILGSVAGMAAQNIWQLLAATFVQAFGASCGSVVTQTVLRDVLIDKEERSKVFAIVGMALAFSPALGPLVGGWLDVSLGWRANYGAMVFLGLLLQVWCYKSLGETRPNNAPKRSCSDLWRLIGAMIRDPFVWTCTLLIGVCNGVLFSFFGEAPYIFVEHLGIAEDLYRWIGIVVSMSIFAAGAVNHRLVKQVGVERLIRIGTLCLLFGAILYLICTVGILAVGIKGIAAGLILMTSLFVVFLGMGMVISNTLSIALKSYQHAVGSAGSIFGFFYYVTIAVFMAGMSMIHSDSLLPLPCYIVLLGCLGFVGTMCPKFWSAAATLEELP